MTHENLADWSKSARLTIILLQRYLKLLFDELLNIIDYAISTDFQNIYSGRKISCIDGERYPLSTRE